MHDWTKGKHYCSSGTPHTPAHTRTRCPFRPQKMECGQ